MDLLKPELLAAYHKRRRRKRGWLIEAVVWCVLFLLYVIFAGPFMFSQPSWASVFAGALAIPLLICWGASIFHRLPPDL